MSILEIAVLLVMAPISTFFCVKFGRVGYLHADEHFAKQQQRKHGQTPKTKE